MRRLVLALLAATALLAAVAAPPAAAADAAQAACPGFFEAGGAGTGRYTLLVPLPADLLAATPEELSSLLGDLTGDLQLQALAVVSNVTVGGYGQALEVPLTTPFGGSLSDPTVPHPWTGEALLSLGYLTGPLFGMEGLAGLGWGPRAWSSQRSSFVEVSMPSPQPDALEIAAAFNAAQAEAAAAGELAPGPRDEMVLYQVATCNASRPVLTYHDVDRLPASLADESISLQELVRLQPALGPLFLESNDAGEHLAMQPGQYVRRQYWPLMADSRLAGFLHGAIFYPKQVDALAGKNATRGELKLMLNAPSYQGPSYGAPVEPATLDDARALMAALQQGLA